MTLMTQKTRITISQLTYKQSSIRTSTITISELTPVAARLPTSYIVFCPRRKIVSLPWRKYRAPQPSSFQQRHYRYEKRIHNRTSSNSRTTSNSAISLNTHLILFPSEKCIGFYISLSETSQIPVRLSRLEQTIVVEERGIGGSLLGGRDGAAQQDGIDSVGTRGGTLVECQDHQGAVDVEIWVCQQGGEPPSGPRASD